MVQNDPIIVPVKRDMYEDHSIREPCKRCLYLCSVSMSFSVLCSLSLFCLCSLFLSLYLFVSLSLSLSLIFILTVSTGKC